MVWGNFFGKNLLDFGGVQTLAWMVWGTFFGDEVPQSARLSAGGGVQKLFGQCPNAFYANCIGASLTDPLIGGMRQSIFEVNLFPPIFCQTNSFSSQLGEKMFSSCVKVLSLVSGKKQRAKAAPSRAVSAWSQ